MKNVKSQDATPITGWGYSRISGALSNLGHEVSRQTIKNVLKKHGIQPMPQRRKHVTWSEFIRSHKDALVGTDFFTTEVWTSLGLTTYYCLFFIHLGTRRVYLAGMTPNPDQEWMKQIARNLTMVDWGFLNPYRFLIHDRDSKFCLSFRNILNQAGIKTLMLPYRSPNLNAFSERWVKTVKEECLSRMILIGEPMLRRVLAEYVAHYHGERNHQGIGNVIPFPDSRLTRGSPQGKVIKSSRLGGMLNYYYRAEDEKYEKQAA